MKPADRTWAAAVAEEDAETGGGDEDGVENPLRRWDANKERDGHDEVSVGHTTPLSSTAASTPHARPKEPHDACPLLTGWTQRLRLLAHQHCPPWAVSAGETAAHGVGVGCRTCRAAMGKLRNLFALLPVLLADLWHSRTERGAGRMPHRRLLLSLSGSKRRVLLCALLSVILAVIIALFFVVWAGLSLSFDPYTEMRVRLSVAYSREEVEDIVAVMRSRASAQVMAVPPRDHDPLLRRARKAVVQMRMRTEEGVLYILSRLLAMTTPDAKQTAQKWVGQLWVGLRDPIPPMLGEYKSIGDTRHLNRSALNSGSLVRATVGQRLLPPTRAAALRCAYGVPTLRPPSSQPGRSTDGDDTVEPSTSETVFEAVWSSFEKANAATTAQPKCLARSQHRLSCADVGLTSDSAAEMQKKPPESESSRVQYLYEHRRFGVDSDALTGLYYDFTPGLPSEARAWHDNPWDNEGDVDPDAMDMRARAQEERFRRTTATALDDAARPFSGVILFLSGAADRNAEGRYNDFVQHALPLLEKHLLRKYPHYPVHVFYEAGPLKPAWSLADVQRYSDVYTIRHGWDPANATHTGRGGQRIHIPPPPPVLVDSVDKLPAMRKRQADSRSWFETVASRVPSAPYVTFENIAPLFSTLPCGVTEEDVAIWAADRRVHPTHRRGYRQMCRFWARLVWRLPSLRLWTESEEGLKETAAYADPQEPPIDDTAVLPPWRYRYTYYLRLDTDSFLHRPVACDPFVTMMAQRCAYGYNSLVLDLDRVTLNLGSAIAEWIDSRTSIKDDERAPTDGNATHAIDSIEDWGLLRDPSLTSLVTLVPAAAPESGVVLPPLPPTWPWSNVYPEHSSAALSAAEKDLLRATFFTDMSNRWGDVGVSAAAPKSKRRRRRERGNGELPNDAAKKMNPDYIPLPLGFASERSYTQAMYYNNFELGTFALKNHPLYTSVTEFFDNRDYDDVTGPEREAAGIDYTLEEVSPGEAHGVSMEGGRGFYAAPVYLLDVQSSETGSGATAAPSSHSPRQCVGRRGKGRVGDDPDMKVPAHKLGRDWRSGYFQYRWGDAPVHTFGVEAAMQREGWGVCAFTLDFGGYEHGDYHEQ